MNPFKNNQPMRAIRAYRAECLNKREGISASMSVSRDQKKYTVCLCLANRIIKTTFPSEFSALEQLGKYRSLYKEIIKKQ